MNANASMEIKKKRRIQFNLTTTHTENPPASPNNLYDNISSHGMSHPGNNPSNPDEKFPSGIHCDQNDNGNIYDNITHLIFASNACVQRRLPRGILTRNPNMDLVMNDIYDNCEDFSQDPGLIYDKVSAMSTDRNIDLEGERKLTETIYDTTGPACATIQHEKEKNENTLSPIPTIQHENEKYGNRLPPIPIVQHVNDNSTDNDYNDVFLDNMIAGCLENYDYTNENNMNSVNEYNSDDKYIDMKFKTNGKRVDRDLVQDHKNKTYGDHTNKDTGQEEDQTGTDRTLPEQRKACREQPETQGVLLQDHKKKDHGHKYTNQEKYQRTAHREQPDNYGQGYGDRSGGAEVVVRGCGSPDRPDPQVVKGGRRPDQKLKRVERDIAQDGKKDVYNDQHKYTNQEKYQKIASREHPDNCDQGDVDRSGGGEVVKHDCPDPQVVRGGRLPDQKLKKVDIDIAQDREKDVYGDQHGHNYTNQRKYHRKVPRDQNDNYWNRPGGGEVVVRGGVVPDRPDPQVVGGGRGPDQGVQRTLCPSQFWAMRARTLVLERLQGELQRCWEIQVCLMVCMMGLGKFTSHRK